MFGKRNIDPAPRGHYRSERVSAINGQYFFSTAKGRWKAPTSPAWMLGAALLCISAACSSRTTSTPAQTFNKHGCRLFKDPGRRPPPALH